MALFQRIRSVFPSLTVLFFCMAILLSYLFSACSPTNGQAQPVPSAMQRRTSSSPLPSPTPTEPKLLRPDLERGMIYPRWKQDSYGVTDTSWRQGIQTMQTQTGATWLEVPVIFSQDTPSSTQVFPGASTPSLEAFASGIRYAVSLGYHVFFIPLSGVSTPDGWAGIIQFNTQQQEQAWFDSYWNTLRPYAQVAQENGAEQMAIGTELSWLQQNAPASLWNQLIARVRTVFKGNLTYDMNWGPSLYDPAPNWMKNPELTAIGLSEYVPLIDTPTRVDPNVLPVLWHEKVGKLVDAFSSQVGKQIILTEVGFRNTSDALYQPYVAQSSAPVDSQEQAAAYAATLSNVFADSHIAGIFFWGWDDVVRMGIAGQPAVKVVYRWYTKTA